jgi:hypothetical protein
MEKGEEDTGQGAVVKSFSPFSLCGLAKEGRGRAGEARRGAVWASVG